MNFVMKGIGCDKFSEFLSNELDLLKMPFQMTLKK